MKWVMLQYCCNQWKVGPAPLLLVLPSLLLAPKTPKAPVVLLLTDACFNWEAFFLLQWDLQFGWSDQIIWHCPFQRTQTHSQWGNRDREGQDWTEGSPTIHYLRWIVGLMMVQRDTLEWISAMPSINSPRHQRFCKWGLGASGMAAKMS